MPVFDHDSVDHPAGIRERDGVRKCYTCGAYGFKPGGEETWAFCYLHEKWFPNPRGWAKGDGSKAPGERSCKRWVEKFTKMKGGTEKRGKQLNRRKSGKV